MKIALTHDWLVTEGGAEKVLQILLEIFPSPVHTLFYDDAKEGVFWSRYPIRASYLQRVPGIKRLYRFLLPFFPRAVESLPIPDGKIIFSHCHSVIKGIRKRPGQFHICYCHTPIRYAWDLQEEYLSGIPSLFRSVVRRRLEIIRAWDLRVSSDVDVFLAGSENAARRIFAAYGKKAEVIYPPVAVEKFFVSDRKKEHYITHCRLVPYKRVDVLLEAFARMPEKKLVIIGDGPEKKRLLKRAPTNVEIRGFVKEEDLPSMLAEAKAYVFTAEEDFGIGIIEAMASGLPVIAFRRGGACETVKEGVSGIFFDRPDSESCKAAIERFETEEHRFDPLAIRRGVLHFSRERFTKEILAAVQKYGEAFL